MLEVRTSSAELGQGLVTVLQMIVAQEFDLPLAQVRVLVMDTDLTPNGGPTTASRQTYVTGNAALYAARTLRQAIATLAEKYDVPPEQIQIAGGLAKVDGHSIPLGEVVKELCGEGHKPRIIRISGPSHQPTRHRRRYAFRLFLCCSSCRGRSESRTGEIRVLRIIAANDVGHTLDPLRVTGSGGRWSDDGNWECIDGRVYR